MELLVPLVAGFLLTTVVGGLLGSFFQRRSWNHQYEVQFAEQERARAAQIFDEISRLLDKRLYRMRLLDAAVRAESPDEDAAHECLAAYRQVLVEWNDGVNRNLALVQQYFGQPMRDRFDHVVGASFVAIGRDLEARWRSRYAGVQPQDPDLRASRRLDELGTAIYAFNLDMLRLLRAGQVGRLVPENRTPTG